MRATRLENDQNSRKLGKASTQCNVMLENLRSLALKDGSI